MKIFSKMNNNRIVKILRTPSQTSSYLEEQVERIISNMAIQGTVTYKSRGRRNFYKD
jgi:hypothetical protein